MSNDNIRFSNKEYTPAQIEYFKSQAEVKEYFAKKVDKTLSDIQQYVESKKSAGENLELKNNSNTKYYLMEDGTVFKYLIEELEFYRLDTKDFTWYSEPSLLGFFFDNTLTFKEIPDFKDYFNEKNITNDNQGIKL